MRLKNLFLAAVMLLAGLQVAHADDAFRKHRYDSWKVMTLPKDAIVFAGNSITDMHGWTEAFGNNPSIINRGNSGGYSYEVLANVESWVRFKPAKVFIKIGTNDLGTNRTEQSIAENIEKTVKIIRRESPNTLIYLQSILPARDQGYKNLKTIEATNKLIKAIADKIDNTTYVDLYSKLGGIRSGKPYSLDNLHLEAYGYKIWVDEIKKYVGLESSYPENTKDIQQDMGLPTAHGMRATYFSVLPTLSTDVLFFGDEMVKNGEWNELLHNQNVKNRGSWWGYGGAIGTVSKFVDATFANNDKGVKREKPAKILLYTGTEDVNNANNALATIETNYAALIAKLKEKAPHTPIALVSLMPTAQANARIKDFNAWLKSKAEADADLTYVNIYTALATETGAANSKYFVGNYLYGTGYVVAARELAKFIGGCTVISDEEALKLKEVFEARTTLNNTINAFESVKVGNALGEYSEEAVKDLKAKVKDMEVLLAKENATIDELKTMAKDAETVLNNLKAKINVPNEQNVAGKQFAICTPLRGNLYAYANNGGVCATSSNMGYATYRWILEKRNDNTYNIKNQGTGTYMNPAAAHNSQIKLTDKVPNVGWTIEYAASVGLYIVRSAETCELNSTTQEGNPIFNWYGDGKKAQNRADAGCQWLFTDVTNVEIEKEPTPIHVVMGTAQEGAADIVEGHIYTITNHQKDGVCYPFYTDNKTLCVGSKNALAAKSYGNRAKFVAEKKGNAFAFKNVETGYYLVWRGDNEGTNNNAGLLKEYDATFCNFTLTAAKEVTNGKIITAKRANGNVGTFVLMANGAWSKWANNTVGYTDKFSNIFTFGDVTHNDEGEVVDESNWGVNVDWHTMQIGGNLYISNNGNADHIALTTTKTAFADADLWYRVGDDTNGYTIYNKEAGANKVLAAPIEMKGDTGSESYPIMVDKKNIPAGYTATWLFAKSTDLGNDVEAYYIYEKDHGNNKLNNRNNKLAFWTGGADKGSSIVWKWAQRTIEVNMSQGAFTAKKGDWAQVWTSKATEPKLTLNAGYNNMSVPNSNDSRIQAFVGNYNPQTYTLNTDADYSIVAYSFDFVMSRTTAIKVIDAKGNEFTSKKEAQSISCQDLDSQSTKFILSGANDGVDLTNFFVTIRKRAIPAEPQFEIFPTRTSADIPYRIPAIATAYDGTVVAVADYRFSRADIGSGRIDLHIRRSHDHGKTWDDIMKPKEMTGDGNKTEGHQETGFGDPCIVGDSESPRMIITSCSGTPGFFAGTRTHHQGWARWYSDDNGATWSKPEYIDEEFIYSKFDKSAYGPIRGWFVGSGRICQSSTTKVGKYYRLYCVGSSCRQGSNETANWVIYSDDFGETWNFLGGCDESPIPGGDEPKAEELPDGSILLSSRCHGGRNYNIFTFTDTKTAQGSWGQVAFSGQSNKGVTAAGNACNGEVMMLPVTRKKDNKKMFLLLQSVPFGNGRANVGIYYKELENVADFRTPQDIAKDWDGHHQSSYISSAYSTMTWQKNNTLGFVYEEDTYGTNGGGYTIIYKNYSIEQITDSAYTYTPAVNADSLTAVGMEQIIEAITAENNVGNMVGQYTKEAQSIMANAYKTYASAPSRQNYERLNAAIASAPRVTIDKECYYTIRNYGRGNKDLLLNANSDTELSVSTDADADNAKWCAVPVANKPNTFYLVNKAFPECMIGKTLAIEKATLLTTNKEEAGLYCIVSNTQGLSKLQCINPTDAAHAYLHLAGDNKRVVPWLASSPTNNAPSFWYIEPTDILTDIQSVNNNALTPNAAITCYDLNGRIISLPQKGQVYIQRGKKYIK